MKKRVNLSVTNDVLTDQRVNRMARTLHDMGFEVHITGVRRKDSKPFNPPYATVKRIPLLFHKKFLFYAEFNLKLFFYLLFRKDHILVSNDLDTLPANHLAARLRRKPLVYDTHEYFTGTPEVVARPLVYRVWKSLERMLFPRQKLILTVNGSIASLYEKEYCKKLYVVRNVPLYKAPSGHIPADELSLPSHKDIIMLQGTGINIDRGAEELVMAMHPGYGIKHALLLIIGSGDVVPALKEMVKREKLEERVWFIDRIPPDELYEYTIHAKIGASLDKDTNINYRYSLPNKLFDYMMAGVPQLISNLPELESIVSKYDTGMMIKSHDPSDIAEAIKTMLSDRDRWKKWHNNSLEAAKTLCWENEEKVVQEVYRQFV
ncbi:MAG: glycosyltransferase [Bacteroidia bacterium]|nr:MAG: glycosyltransferase [Bacteroidia bacterium]